MKYRVRANPTPLQKQQLVASSELISQVLRNTQYAFGRLHCLCVWAVFLWLVMNTFSSPVYARAISDGNDAAFAGGISIRLPPAGLNAFAKAFQLSSGALNISMNSTSTNALISLAFFGTGVQIWTSGGVGATQGVTFTLSPQSNIWVNKNILVWANTASAGLKRFNQRFSLRTTQNIPQPGTLHLLCIFVLAGLVSRYRDFNPVNYGKSA